MITVKKTGNTRQLYFPFTLQLGSEFRLSVSGEGLVQKFKTKLSGSSSPQLIAVTGSWQPDIAKDMLTDVSKFCDTTDKVPQHIGLRAAYRTLSPRKQKETNSVTLTPTQPERSDQVSTNPWALSSVLSGYFCACVLCQLCSYSVLVINGPWPSMYAFSRLWCGEINHDCLRQTYIRVGSGSRSISARSHPKSRCCSRSFRHLFD